MPDVISTAIVDSVVNQDSFDFAAYQAAKRNPKKEPEKIEVTPTRNEQASAPAPEATEPKSEEAKPEAESETAQKTTQENHGKNTRTFERIQELVKNKKIAEDENAQLKARLKQLESVPVAPSDTNEPKLPSKPKLEGFVSPDEYEKAVEDWLTKKAAHDSFQKSKEERAKAVERQQLELRNNFQKSCTDALQQGRFSDFKPYSHPSDGGPIISDQMLEALSRLEDPANVVYYLQTNPDFAKRLWAVQDAHTVAATLGRIEGRLTQGSQPMATPEQPVIPKPAFKPTVTLKGSGESPLPDLNDASDITEYRRMKARRTQI